MSIEGPCAPRAWLGVVICLALACLAWEAWQVGAAPYPVRYDYDEGVYAATAAAAAHGARLYADAFLSQPPLLILALREAFRTWGSTLEVARGTVVLSSLVWLLALFAIPAAMGRARAGALAVCAAIGSTAFLTAGHSVQMEAPSEALAAAAVAAAALGRHRTNGLWWAAAGALWGLAVMTKLTAAPSAVPLVGLALAGAEQRRRMAALAVGAGLVLTSLLPVIAGRAFLTQVVLFHLALARLLGADPAGHALIVARFLAAEWPLGAAAGAGIWLGATRAARLPRVIIAWLATECAVALTLTPLWPHHLVILLSPLALLAGVGMDGLVDASRRIAGVLAAFAGVLAAFAYLVAGFAAAGPPASSPQLREASVRLSAAVPPDGRVLTDDPMVAFLAGRGIPPAVIDTSIARIEARALPGSTLAAVLRDARVQAVVLWRGTFREWFPEFVAQAEERFPTDHAAGGSRVLLMRDTARTTPEGRPP